MKFTKNEFLNFFHDHVNICVLPDKEKKQFMSWKEFKRYKVTGNPNPRFLG
ncbi:MAG: hypothetical protein ACE5DM_00695 [Candidatus Nanoarchaeia archaeon]